MKKRLVAFLAAAIVLTGLSVAGASPAAALHTENTCVAQGNAQLSASLGLPVVHSPTSASFTISSNAAVCVGTGGVGTSVSAAGSLTGFCGQSNGAGTVSGPSVGSYTFTYVSAASVLVLVGSGGSEFAGVANAVANAAAGSSCAAKTANNFLVTAALVFGLPPNV